MLTTIVNVIPVPTVSDTDKHLWADPFATSAPTQTSITFTSDMFQETAGKIEWYEIIVAKAGKEDTRRMGVYADKTEIPETELWNEDGEPYRATQDYWNPFTGQYIVSLFCQ